MKLYKLIERELHGVKLQVIEINGTKCGVFGSVRELLNANVLVSADAPLDWYCIADREGYAFFHPLNGERLLNDFTESVIIERRFGIYDL